jgi:hypothetical protein
LKRSPQVYRNPEQMGGGENPLSDEEFLSSRDADEDTTKW